VSGGQRDVWTIPADGGTPFPVTHDPSTDWGPVWSPDGQFIYFSSDRGGVMNLWRIRVQEETGKVSGDPQPVTTGVVASVEHASFSVDSKKILYSAVVRSSNLQKLRFDPDRETVVGSPTWSPRGPRHWTGQPSRRTNSRSRTRPPDSKRIAFPGWLRWNRSHSSLPARCPGW